MSRIDPATETAPFGPGDPLPPWCQRVWDGLAARAAHDSLPHALLLCGPAGLGKRAFADAFLRARLCQTPRQGQACGDCHGCRLFTAGTHPDQNRVTLEVNPKTGILRREILVEQIRNLCAQLATSSQLGGWRVAVVDPADRMNAVAQNALLKTLEEPGADRLLLLVSDRPWLLAATIRSRCQRVDVESPPQTEALAWLEGRGIEHAGAALSATGGNPGLAWQLVEQGGMRRRQEVAGDLLALAAGRARAREVAKVWDGDEPEQRLEQASRLMAGALRARAGARATAFDPGWSDDALATSCADADRLRVRLGGPLRRDLALFEWLDSLPVGIAGKPRT